MRVNGNRAELPDWRHPREVDPDAYRRMLLELKPFKDKMAAIEAEIATWEDKVKNNILNGKCPRCKSAFHQEVRYPLCTEGCGGPSLCEYCLTQAVEGEILCRCKREVDKLYLALSDTFGEKSQVCTVSYRNWLTNKAQYLKYRI